MSNTWRRTGPPASSRAASIPISILWSSLRLIAPRSRCRSLWGSSFRNYAYSSSILPPKLKKKTSKPHIKDCKNWTSRTLWLCWMQMESSYRYRWIIWKTCELLCTSVWLRVAWPTCRAFSNCHTKTWWSTLKPTTHGASYPKQQREACQQEPDKVKAPKNLKEDKYFHFCLSWQYMWIFTSVLSTSFSSLSFNYLIIKLLLKFGIIFYFFFMHSLLFILLQNFLWLYYS